MELKERIIWCDTRQKGKQWDWLKEEFKTRGYKIKDDKPMTYGDYCMPPNLSVLIDTKYCIQEIVGNVTQQHVRFRNELIGAKEMGATLHILIVNEENVKCIEDLNKWENPRIKTWAIQRNRARRTGKPYPKQPPTSGKQLAKILTTMQNEYGAIFDFCKKSECADRIIEILTEGVEK